MKSHSEMLNRMRNNSETIHKRVGYKSIYKRLNPSDSEDAEAAVIAKMFRPTLRKISIENGCIV